MAERTCTHPEIRIHLAFSLGDSAIFAEMVPAFDRIRFRLTLDKVQVQVVLTGFEPDWHHSDLPGEWFRSALWHPSFRTSVAKLRADPETRCHREQSELFISMEGRASGAKYVWIPDRRSAFGVRRCLTCPE
ncbi:MAG: hypothetical protein RID22_26410 [Roseibium aggregatum]